jgi:hypothetical protein
LIDETEPAGAAGAAGRFAVSSARALLMRLPFCGT